MSADESMMNYLFAFGESKNYKESLKCSNNFNSHGA
jgi:hypothetical protein